MYRLVANKPAIIIYVTILIISVFTSIYKLISGNINNDLILNNWSINVVLQQLLVVLFSFLLREQLLKIKVVGNRDSSIAVWSFLVLSSLPTSLFYFRLILAAIVAVIVIVRIAKLYSSNVSPVVEFEIGMLVGAAGLVHQHFLFLLPLAIVGIVLVKATSWKHITALILGLLFVLSFKLLFYLYTDQLSLSQFNRAFGFQLNTPDFTVFGVGEYLMFSAVALLLIPLQYNRTVADTMNIKDRLIFRLWYYFFLAQLITLIALGNAGEINASLGLLSIPLFVLAEPYWNKRKKRWVNDVFLFLFFMLVLVAYVN